MVGGGGGTVPAGVSGGDSSRSGGDLGVVGSGGKRGGVGEGGGGGGVSVHGVVRVQPDVAAGVCGGFGQGGAELSSAHVLQGVAEECETHHVHSAAEGREATGEGVL